MSGRGLPSWYKYRAYGPVYEEIRLAEHAVRLGSPVSFDRRGDVIWFDDFEHGLGKWQKIITGAGGAVTLYALTARTGGLSAKILTSAVNGEETGIVRVQPALLVSPAGFECSFVSTQADYFIRLYLHVYDGASVYEFEVRFRAGTSTMSYRNSTPEWVNLSPTQKIYFAGGNFNTIKLVADPIAGKYSRVMLNGRAWDMSSLTPRSTPSTFAPSLYTAFTVDTQDSDPVALYADDAIITQNEP